MRLYKGILDLSDKFKEDEVSVASFERLITGFHHFEDNNIINPEKIIISKKDMDKINIEYQKLHQSTAKEFFKEALDYDLNLEVKE